MKLQHVWVWLLSTCLVFSVGVSAQTSTGVITGLALDPQGGVVPGGDLSGWRRKFTMVLWVNWVNNSALVSIPVAIVTTFLTTRSDFY